MPRLPDIVPERLEPEQRLVYDAIVAGPRGRVEGPLRVWIRSPELADRAQALGAFCRYGSSLPPRLSELAILVTGAHWKAGFEWYAHAPIAAKAGLASAVIEAIRTGVEPQFTDEAEAAVYAFTSEIWRSRRVSDATYARALAALGERSVVDLAGVLGYYALISITINAFEVPLPPGEPEPFV